MAPIKCDGSVPNQRVAAPLRAVNRNMICEALVNSSLYGVEIPALWGTAESVEREIYDESSDETDYLRRVSIYIQRTQDTVLIHGDFQLGAFIVGSSSRHPQEQPQAGPPTVGSSSRHPQQQPQPLAGVPQQQPLAGAPPHQQQPLAGAPQQQQPLQEANISEDVLKRFYDLQDWAARSGR